MGATLVHHLRAGARAHPDKIAFRFLADGEQDVAELTFGALHERALGLALYLRACTSPGDRVVLLFSAGLDSVISLYACLMAGVIAIPAAAPHPGRIRARAEQLARLVRDCHPAIVLTSSELVGAVGEFAAVSWELAAPRWIAVDSWAQPALDIILDPDPAHVALLQYTSGSTSAPRGVMLTHANLLANQVAIGEMTGPTQQSEMLSWLPFFHDMGLCFYLHPIYLGITCTLMSPSHFMQRPLRWLRAISCFGSTASSAPSFALDRVADQLAASADLGDLDLRSLRLLAVGAEPVRARTLDRFCAATEPLGFRREALFPGYGLAETTLLGTTGPSGAPTIRRFQNASLAPGRLVRVAGAEDTEAAILVGNGAASQGHELVIVDASGELAASGEVGEIWLHGPSVGQGYWGRPLETEALFGATRKGSPRRYLRTGDLGFDCDGELYVCGRLKDLIILLGRNIYPEDVEEIARTASPEVGEGAAAFQSSGESQALVLLVEAASRHWKQPQATLLVVREAVSRGLEIEVGTLALLPPLSLPRTNSGKVQRGLARSAYDAGELAIIEAWRAPALEMA
jgi:acyl-CoA synthetase (AMP-forming)/AMP-acid ligase II